MSLNRQEVPKPDQEFNEDYLLESDEEPLRLERQALIYSFEDDLTILSLSSNERVLDAGCGAGSITRAIAQDNTNGFAIGVDRDPKFIDYAARKAASEGIENIVFKTGDVLDLPFEDNVFDVVWSKHVLQWVGERQQALKEFIRVLNGPMMLLGGCRDTTTPPDSYEAVWEAVQDNDHGGISGINAVLVDGTHNDDPWGPEGEDAEDYNFGRYQIVSELWWDLHLNGNDRSGKTLKKLLNESPWAQECE